MRRGEHCSSFVKLEQDANKPEGSTRATLGLFF